MTDERKIDLDGPPDPGSEIRLALDGRVTVSIWLPADATAAALAMRALADHGFALSRTQDTYTLRKERP